MQIHLTAGIRALLLALAAVVAAWSAPDLELSNRMIAVAIAPLSPGGIKAVTDLSTKRNFVDVSGAPTAGMDALAEYHAKLKGKPS
jgi:hypothetical protein